MVAAASEAPVSHLLSIFVVGTHSISISTIGAKKMRHRETNTLHDGREPVPGTVAVLLDYR